MTLSLRVFKNLGLKYKILGGYTLIFILSTLFGGTIIYYKVRKTIESSIESELAMATATIKNMVETAASTSIKNHLRAVADKNKEIVERIYKEYTQGRLTEQEAKSRATFILFSQTIGKTGYIYCANSDGIAIEHPVPGVTGRNFISHEFVRQMVRQKQGYLEYDWQNPQEKHKRPKAMYMAYFEPWDWIISASSYREEFKELINVSDFKESILELKFGKTGYSYITDTKGSIIVHPFLSGNHLERKDQYGYFLMKTITDMKNGKLLYSWKNPGETIERDKMVIFNHLPEYDWIVASTSYLDEIYSPLKTIRTIVIITIGLVLILGFALSFWINNLIVSPIKALMNRFSSGAMGNFSTRMPVPGTDEIGQLANYFNSFMEKLEKFSGNLNSEIARHKKTAHALFVSEEKYRAILERMEEGYFEVDLSGRFVFFNNSMKNILQIPHSSLVGGRIHDFTDKEHSQKIERIFLKVKMSGLAEKISGLEFNLPDETICSVETSVSLIKDKTDIPIGFSGVIRDVTERKKAEKALKCSEEMFSKVFRSSPSGMFISTISDGELINVNNSILKSTEYGLLELTGKKLPEIRFFQNSGDYKRLIKSLNANGHIEKQEITFLTLSGKPRVGVISAERVELMGMPCLLASLEDITESRKLERRILDISERERQKIAMELHDDLCPQLIGIEVMVTILKEKIETRSDDPAGDAVKIREFILDAISKTRQLSKGLNPVNLADRGFDKSLQDLAEYIEDVFNISCTLNYDASVSFQDNNTATHIYYIVHEAVHNCVKHARASRISIRLKAVDDKVIINVEDNGSGIPEMKNPKGMGVQLMKYRARRIGGQFEMYKSSGKGTRVVLTVEK